MNQLLAMVILSSCLSTTATAQQDCTQLKAENESLRKALNITKAIKEVSADKIEFKLTKVEGNTKSQTVTCTVILTTTAADWYINPQIKSIIDIEGNEYLLKSATYGALDYGAINLYTGVPIKCTFTFKGILPTVKVIKLFKFKYSHRAGEPYSVEFRDMDIDWK